MLDCFEVSAPTAKRQVARPNKHVAFTVAGEDRDFRVKYASHDRYRLDIIIFTDSARSLLSQGRSHTLDVGKN
jgi:hypothetical protein